MVCIVLIGIAGAVVPGSAPNSTAASTPTPRLIGGDTGTYLVLANVDGANVTFDSDYKGVISGGKLAVSVYTTGTPYRTITVEKPGYEVFTEPITQYPGMNGTVEIPVTLVPISTSAAVNVTTAGQNAASPSATMAGTLPFAACAAFVVGGIFAIRMKK